MVVLRLCDRGPWNRVATPVSQGKWLKCRSISFFGFFAIYEPKTCHDDISGMTDGDAVGIFDSVVMMVEGVEKSWLKE